MKHLTRTPILLATAFLFACGGGEPAAENGEPSEDASAPAASAEMSASQPAVSITEPEAGATVLGDRVRVHLTASGIEIVPAGEIVEGTAHHHLFLDVESTEAGETIPAGVDGVVHLGDGSSEYVFEGVAAGEHRIIALLADGLHVPLEPLVADTVVFTVIHEEEGEVGME